MGGTVLDQDWMEDPNGEDWVAEGEGVYGGWKGRMKKTYLFASEKGQDEGRKKGRWEGRGSCDLFWCCEMDGWVPRCPPGRRGYRNLRAGVLRVQKFLGDDTRHPEGRRREEAWLLPFWSKQPARQRVLEAISGTKHDSESRREWDFADLQSLRPAWTYGPGASRGEVILRILRGVSSVSTRTCELKDHQGTSCTCLREGLSLCLANMKCLSLRLVYHPGGTISTVKALRMSFGLLLCCPIPCTPKSASSCSLSLFVNYVGNQYIGKQWAKIGTPPTRA